jgi:hypothetical protein
MKVLCTSNSGTSLSAKHFECGYTASSAFDLVPGTEYTVYGICLWRSLLLYLIVGQGSYPHWDPAELFQVTHPQLPNGWYFAFFGYEVELNAISGYDELVNKREYFDQLSNLETPALEIFEMRRREIDRFS